MFLTLLSFALVTGLSSYFGGPKDKGTWMSLKFQKNKKLNKVTAYKYAAFRPLLCILGNSNLSEGLDVKEKKQTLS